MQSKDSVLPTDDEGVSEEAEEHWQAWKVFSLDAYARFQATLEQIRRRHPGLTRYDIVERIDAAKGTFAWHWGSASEVRESINSLNAWGVRLHEWQAWNDVVSGYEEKEDKWDILHHFLEPVAYYCMLQPSSFADRLVLTAENLLHQANQSVNPDEPDHLMQDDQPDKHLRRSDRRTQLSTLGRRWKTFAAFRQKLSALNGKGYSKLTRNFRDLAAHSFSPRLLLGHVSRAIRSIEPHMDMVRQADGSYLRTEHPTKKVVSYAMSTHEPLSLEETYKANLAEYQRARVAMERLITLTEELCDEVDRKSVNAGTAP